MEKTTQTSVMIYDATLPLVVLFHTELYGLLAR